MSNKSLLQVPSGSENPVFRWMVQELNYENGGYWLCGEVLLTPLVEAACSVFDRPHWLEDDEHWVWDAAFAASLWRRK